MNINFQNVFLKELEKYFSPIVNSKIPGLAVFEILEDAGWDLKAIAGIDENILFKHFEKFDGDFRTVIEENHDKPISIQELLSILNIIKTLFDSFRILPSLLKTTKIKDLSELPGDVINALTQIYLNENYPATLQLLNFLTAFKIENPEFISLDGNLIRVRNKLPILRPDRISDLLTNTGEIIRQEYWPTGIKDLPTARKVAEKAFPLIQNFLLFLNIDSHFGFNLQLEDLKSDEVERLKGLFTFDKRFYLQKSDEWKYVGASIGILPENEGGPGVYVIPFGELEIEEIIGDWEISLQGKLDTSGFQITKSGFKAYARGKTSLGVDLKITPIDQDNVLVIGNSNGTRLEIGNFMFGGSLDFRGSSSDEIKVSAALQKGALIIKGSDGDGLLNTILPKNGVRCDFSFVAAWSNINGIHFEGSGGLELQLPAHIDLGPINCERITLAIHSKNDAIPLQTGVSLRTTFGPVNARIENVGLSLDLTFPETGGNLGLVNLDLGFKPPTGVGLSIDGGGFKGGGFLQFDHERFQYYGILEVNFQNTIALKATGLLTTRMPDGSEGFSLLLILSAQFNPGIQLGFGFALSGVGGLIGVNRSTRLEVLRDGLRKNTLDSVLFPKDVVKNANRVISEIRQVFPPQTDRVVLGPVALITWGVPPLLSIRVGMVLEIPTWRIALMGVLKAVIPSEDFQILRLQVAFLGTFEPDKKLISFDSSLFDSKLLAFTLDGDMALRIAYGDKPNFLLSVGGFHPGYTPPPIPLPTLRRMSLSLLAGNNPRLRLETYMAVTSNTVQFGARLELYAKAWKFNVYGFLAFDALFQLNPFYFTVGVEASLAVRLGSAVLFSVRLAFSLSGPTPWNANGTASFRIALFIKIKVRFNKTWGEDRDTRLPGIRILPLLKAALAESGNWEAQIPKRHHLLVTLRDLNATEISEIVLVHPAGELTILQKHIPLGVDLSKVGSRPIEDTKRLSIERVEVMQQDSATKSDLTFIDVQEEFAPAQFLDLVDEEKLSRPSFEKIDAGVRISLKGSSTLTGELTDCPIEYEKRIVDKEFRSYVYKKRQALTYDQYFYELHGSAITRSPLSLTNVSKSPLSTTPVTIKEETYSVVDVTNLKPHGEMTFGSELEANQYLHTLIQSDPQLADELQVMSLIDVS